MKERCCSVNSALVTASLSHPIKIFAGKARHKTYAGYYLCRGALSQKWL